MDSPLASSESSNNQNTRGDVTTEKNYFKAMCENLKSLPIPEQLEYLIPKDFKCCHNSSDLFEEQLDRLEVYDDEHEGGKLNHSEDQFRKELWMNYSKIKKENKKLNNNGNSSQDNCAEMLKTYIKSLNKELAFSFLRKKELKEFMLERATLLFEIGNYQEALKGFENIVQIGALNKKRDWIKFIREYTTLLCMNNQQDKALALLEQKLQNQNLLTEQEVQRLEKHRRNIKNGKFKKESFVISDGSIQNKLMLNERVVINRRSTNQKLGVSSIKWIPKDVLLLEESPVVFVVRKQARRSFCCECLKKCEYSFVPCPDCAEVVFCSPKCKQKSEWHQFECGFVELIEECFGVYALQVFRVLSILGVEEMLSDEAEEYSAYVYDIRRPIDSQSIKERVRNWFRAQKALRERIRLFTPERIQAQVSSAMGLLLVYYKRNVDDMHLTRSGFCKLLIIMAEEIVRTEVFNYLWSVKNEKKEKIPLANYQVMIAQNLSPSCVPNSLWDFNGTVYSLRTTRPISEGEEITISYGSVKTDSFFKRQSHNVKFCSLCSCDLCLREVKQHFALRCDNCNGPIPYSTKLLQNFLCMICNKPTIFKDDYLIKLQQSYQLLPILQRFLLTSNEQSCSTIQSIDSIINELIEKINLNNDNLQRTVLKFCKVCLKNNYDQLAIELYYKYFTNGIDITANGSQLEVIDNRLDCINTVLAAILNDSLPQNFNAHALYGFALTLHNKIEATPFASIYFGYDETRKRVASEFEQRVIFALAQLENVEAMLGISKNRSEQNDNSSLDESDSELTVQEQYDRSIAEEVYERDLIHSLGYLVEPLDSFPRLEKTFGYSSNEDALLNSILRQNSTPIFSEANLQQEKSQEAPNKPASKQSFGSYPSESESSSDSELSDNKKKWTLFDCSDISSQSECDSVSEAPQE